MNAKAKGSRNERRSRALLEAVGYRVTRAAGSLGEWDLIGLSATDVVLVQVKTRDWPGTLERLEAGMIFTIEPMINAGRRDIRQMVDGWTIKTKDRSLSAQWEHTVLVTETGYEVLTLSAGSPPPPDFITKGAATVAA